MRNLSATVTLLISRKEKEPWDWESTQKGKEPKEKNGRRWVKTPEIVAHQPDEREDSSSQTNSRF